MPKITTAQLLGYMLHRENCIHDRSVATVDPKLFLVSRDISLDEALFMLSSYKLGRTGYISLRQELKTKIDLPAHYRLMQHKSCQRYCISLILCLVYH